ncbi:hypothetical protein Mal15_53340 [Stieleria maiorica]|uniref:DUF6798 domain-containing protein n=1 Tax=Stieleria maiorica TaxID=2795974 RepID=A0A5B9MQJ4_9BACT|nr:DUF6798 domain-containing protein [Stieleria maiorica]QEG01258.1 hypothetical protein Mal15_53340 [Stieleria maiorica]
MSAETSIDELPAGRRRSVWSAGLETVALLALFFVYAADPPPAVNEAHYLVKAKNFWDPTFCSQDLFAASGKAHTTFYWTFGALTQVVSLEATAWIGRLIGWTMLAIGLVRCCRSLSLPAFSSLGVATLWLVGIEYGNLAGEWVVGGIEAKVPAYAMVLMGMAEIARHNWSRGWIWFGGASAFHVLTGGWAVVAGAIAFGVTEKWFRSPDQPPARFFSVGLFIGGALALLGLLPAIRLTLGATAEESVQAAKIYSYMRIRHHLLPGDFPLHWFVRHGVLAGALVMLVWRGRATGEMRRVIWIGTGALMIAGCGLIVGALPAVMPDLAAKLLRYYWFRLSDAIVPLVLALWMMRLIVAPKPGGQAGVSRALAVLVLLTTAGMLIHSATQRNRIGIPPSTSHRLLGVALNADAEQQQRSHRDWVAVCDWVRVAMPGEEIFLTPRHQQTFKWYSSRAEVANWKDVPQDATSLLQWQKRFDDIFPKRMGVVSFNSMRVPIRYSRLREYRERYGVRFMIVDNRIATKRLPLVKVYPVAGQQNETYSVYELPYD